MNKPNTFESQPLDTEQLQSPETAEQATGIKERSEQNYRQLAEAMPQMVWVANTAGEIEYFNRRWFEYTGMTHEEILGAPGKTLIHPEDVPLYLERWSQSLETGEDYRIEYRFKRGSDGEYRWHLGQALPVCDADGKITKWFGTCTDIHEQKKVEEELRLVKKELESRVEDRTAELSAVAASLAGEVKEREIVQENLRVREERFQLATAATNDVVWDWDLTTDVLWWSRNFQKLFGYSVAETGTDISSWTERLHPDDLQQVKESIYQAIESGEQSWSGEYRFRCGDGSYAFVADRGFVVYDDGKKPIRMVGSMMDITERKRAEKAVQESRDYLDRIINAVTDPIFVNDRQHRMVLVNDAFCHLEGRAREEIIGKNTRDLCRPDEAERFIEIDNLVFETGKDTSIEEQFTDLQGQSHVLLTRKTLYADQNGDGFGGGHRGSLSF